MVKPMIEKNYYQNFKRNSMLKSMDKMDETQIQGQGQLQDFKHQGQNRSEIYFTIILIAVSIFMIKVMSKVKFMRIRQDKIKLCLVHTLM